MRAEPPQPAVPAPAQHPHHLTVHDVTVHRGHVFHVAGAPSVQDAADALVSIPDGALVVHRPGGGVLGGTIAWVGAYAELPAEYHGAPVEGGRDDVLLPGFVDAHMHFPQVYSTDAFGGGQLLEWLERSIFPAEARLADPAFAQQAARDFTRRRIAAGTTAALVFGSAFPHAQDALYAETVASGLRMVTGRGIQTVGPPAAASLVTGELEAVELTRAEIDMWHAVDAPGRDFRTARIQSAIVPRFSLSVTRETLRALGDLYDEVRDLGVYFHSHLSENDHPLTGEVASVRGAYGVEHYLDTYDGRFEPGSEVGGSSLLGRRSILAHAVHCSDAELARLAETGSSIAHCPTSQLFLGSGTMPWRRTIGHDVTVAIGTDVAGGDEWLIPRVLGDVYKVHMSEPHEDAVALHPAQLLFSATLAGARALDMEDRFGNFDVGKDADFVRITPAAWQPLELLVRHALRADDERTAAAQLLFLVLLTVREPAITGVWVQGHRLIAA